MSNTGSDLFAMAADPEPPETPRRRSRTRRIVLTVIALLLGVAVVVGGAIAWFGFSLAGDIGRIDDPFTALPEAERPAVPEVTEEKPERGTTFLLAGTDRRSDVPTTGSKAKAPAWQYGQQRSDTIMLVHLTGDGQRAYVVSIPRDSWIDIPGYGKNKANAAYSFGGPSLFVKTIEKLSDVRVDNVAVVDWTGVKDLIDAMGGVELTFATPTITPKKTWPAGTHTLTGEEALDYMSERKRLPNGDFGRIQRQQNVLRAIADGLITQDVLGSPSAALATAKAITKSVSVDESLGLRDMVALALKAKDLRPRDVIYVTVPSKGVGQVGDQSVVFLDTKKLDGFFEALKNDELEDWIEQNDLEVTGKSVY